MRIYRGRQKTTIKKIDNNSNLQVTFSKRRTGLFKKANELAIICGAEVAFIVFSPAKNVYTFSHPSLDLVMNNYLDYYDPNSNNYYKGSQITLSSEISSMLEDIINQPDSSKANKMLEDIIHQKPTSSTGLEEIAKAISDMRYMHDESKEKGKELDDRDAENPFEWDVTKADGLSLESVEVLTAKMEMVWHHLMVAKANQALFGPVTMGGPGGSGNV